ncbi:hypothetical protein J6590_102758, partial [Homalodisca vitripennis]
LKESANDHVPTRTCIKLSNSEESDDLRMMSSGVTFQEGRKSSSSESESLLLRGSRSD